MLVLSRKVDESIVIGDNITIKVISVEKGVVKLGVDAPKNVSIVRNELLEDVKDANIAASKGTKLSDLTSLSAFIKK